MPYIGKSPVAGGFHKLDNLTASATATYALTLGGAAYYPESANQLLVSLNGVIQAPQDSFTVSGSNIVFDSALTASDSIDFIVALGDVIGVGSVTDGAITTAKLGNNAVTSAKLDTNIDIAGTLDVTGALTADSGIYLGGTALKASTGTIEIKGSSATQSIITNSDNSASYANGATLTFGNRSGVLIVNNWSNGSVELFVMGGGSVSRFAGSGTGAGTVVYSAPNYVWTNDTGSTHTYTHTFIQTRNAA